MNHDRATLDDQIQAYLDGTAGEADLQAVADAVRNEPAAANLLARHTLLRELLEDHYADGSDLLVLSQPAMAINAAGRPRRVWLSAAAVMAALLALIMFGWGTWLPRVTNDKVPVVPTVAVVAAHSPALQWEAAAAAVPARGTSLAAGPITIGEGTISLLLSSGVELTVDGPAQFDLNSDMQVLLAAGHISAVVPEGSEGFVIEAPGLRVVDLGTEFEVTVPPDGRPQVAVRRGAVEASFVGSPTSMRIGEAERHRFDPTTRTSEPLGTITSRLPEPSSQPIVGHQPITGIGRPTAPAPWPGSSSSPTGKAAATGSASAATVSIGSDAFLAIDSAQSLATLNLGETGGTCGLQLLPGGTLSVDQLHVSGHSRLHLAGGMLTLTDDRHDANICGPVGTHLDLVIDGGYLIAENVIRLAHGRQTHIDMQLNGGLVEARRSFVLSERGGSRLLQTGGQFRVANNLFLHSLHTEQPVRYTIRGGTLTGPGSLRLGDWQATDAIFRVEGTKPTIQLGRLTIASDRGVLEYLINAAGVSPIMVEQVVSLNDQGALRLSAAAGDRPLPQQVVLLRYGNRRGQFARVELDGLTGNLVYDDKVGEIRLEQINRTKAAD